MPSTPHLNDYHRFITDLLAFPVQLAHHCWNGSSSSKECFLRRSWGTSSGFLQATSELPGLPKADCTQKVFPWHGATQPVDLGCPTCGSLLPILPKWLSSSPTRTELRCPHQGSPSRWLLRGLGAHCALITGSFSSGAHIIRVLFASKKLWCWNRCCFPKALWSQLKSPKPSSPLTKAFPFLTYLMGKPTVWDCYHVREKESI